MARHTRPHTSAESGCRLKIKLPERPVRIVTPSGLSRKGLCVAVLCNLLLASSYFYYAQSGRSRASSTSVQSRRPASSASQNGNAKPTRRATTSRSTESVNTDSSNPSPSDSQTNTQSGSQTNTQSGSQGESSNANKNPSLPSNLPPPPAPPARRSTQSEANDADASSSNDNEILDEGDEVTIRSNLVPIAASVVDATGYALTDLTLKDFELQVDGNVKSVSDIHRAETPVRLVMLFDNSGSLNFARELELKAALKFFKQVIRPIDRAAIFSVSTDVKVSQPFTNDVSQLTRTIENFDKPKGATKLFEAITLAATYLHPHKERKIILIVSDGADTLSSNTFDMALNSAQAADCQIYAVHTGYTSNVNLMDLGAARRLQIFAAQTGGAVYTPQNERDIDTAFAQVAADLQHQYVLSYYPTNEPADGKFKTISLRVLTRPNVRIRTRKGYYAPQS